LSSTRYSSKLAQLSPPSASPNSLNYSIHIPSLKFSICRSPNSQDYGLHDRLITSSKCICALAQSQPASIARNTHKSSLQVRSIMSSKYICEVAQTQHLECISEFPRLQCGETDELDRWQPIIYTQPHLT
jgi:hypothetical protein